MSAELTTTDNQLQQQHGGGIFEKMAQSRDMNVGAVAIEQERAIAEAQGQLVLAKKFPRSMAAARSDLLDACQSLGFSQSAFYSVPNRGSGPSIRFAEEVARVYGNFQYGHRELSRTPARGSEPGRSEVEVYAWDMEKNNRSIRQITVLHIRDKTGGATKLTDQTDIDNRVANVASKQMRGRILALVPKDLVAAGIAACKATLAGNAETPLSERIAKMAEAFKKLGVSVKHLSDYVGRPVDEITADEIADLTGVYNAIKEGTPVSEFFGAPEEKPSSEAKSAVSAAAGITADKKPEPAGKAAGKPKAEEKKPAATKKAAPAPEPEPEPDPKPELEQEEHDAPESTDDDDVF